MCKTQVSEQTFCDVIILWKSFITSDTGLSEKYTKERERKVENKTLTRFHSNYSTLFNIKRYETIQRIKCLGSLKLTATSRAEHESTAKVEEHKLVSEHN